MNTAKKITSTDLLKSLASEKNWRDYYQNGKLSYREKGGWLSRKQAHFLLTLMDREGIFPPHPVAKSDFWHREAGFHISRPMPNGARSWILREEMPPLSFSDMVMETSKGEKPVVLRMDLIAKGKVSPERIKILLKCSSAKLIRGAEDLRHNIRENHLPDMNAFFEGMIDAIEQILELRKADPDWTQEQEENLKA